MNIKSRIAKLEKFNSKGIEVIFPVAEFIGGEGEDCSHAIASLQDGKPFEARRKSGECFSDFRHRFVSGYIEDFLRQLACGSQQAVILEHDADLL